MELVDRPNQGLALFDRIVLAQRVTLKPFVHEYAFQVRMPPKADPEHVPDLALEPERPAQNHGGVAPVDVGRRHCVQEPLPDRLDQGIHGSKINGRGSGTDRLPVVCCPWILSWSFINPSSTISGRGGHPGM